MTADPTHHVPVRYETKSDTLRRLSEWTGTYEEFVEADAFVDSWRTGSGVPSDEVGEDGDFYLDVDSGVMYERAGGAYVSVAASDVPAGVTWRDGIGLPDDSVGIDGDFYLCLSTGRLYRRHLGNYGYVSRCLTSQGINEVADVDVKTRILLGILTRDMA